MEDRDAVVEEPRRIEEHEVKLGINGDHKIVSSSPQQPPKKRVRYTEPPIWARSVRNKGSLGLGAKLNSKVNGKLPMGSIGIYPASQAPPPIKAEMNGINQASPAISRAAPPLAMQDDPSVILGPWEKTITNVKPQDEITKCVADFLFANVVSRGDLGELASRGVEIEIEAKLGQIIDKDTNERYQLPVASECVLRPNAGLAFRSSMTEGQHRSLNDFLNKRVAETHPNNPQPKKRVKIDYLHRHERDTFYELPPTMLSHLPAVVREQLNPRHRIKVRVSHDQKTGQVLAKIIKCRITDLDIFNPKSPLDCRISINFEMRFDMELEEILAASTGDRQPDRNKDRLSYTQSHYQIDLTQVTQTTNTHTGPQTVKEHELEIEVSTAAIRDQGQRAALNQANEYLALVEGLVDNVRVLARATPAPQ
ncbi:mRNA triphosphatase CET1 [Acephala macrosclerotiorum]|nr:mRNA triphosphatase CET1 [Acephala macrosclerotiorum]